MKGMRICADREETAFTINSFGVPFTLFGARKNKFDGKKVTRKSALKARGSSASPVTAGGAAFFNCSSWA